MHVLCPAQDAVHAHSIPNIHIITRVCPVSCPVQDAVDRGWLRDARDCLTSHPNMDAVLATALEIAAAMRYLHAHGIVHGGWGWFLSWMVGWFSWFVQLVGWLVDWGGGVWGRGVGMCMCVLGGVLWVFEMRGMWLLQVASCACTVWGLGTWLLLNRTPWFVLLSSSPPSQPVGGVCSNTTVGRTSFP